MYAILAIVSRRSIFIKLEILDLLGCTFPLTLSSILQKNLCSVISLQSNNAHFYLELRAASRQGSCLNLRDCNPTRSTPCTLHLNISINFVTGIFEWEQGRIETPFFMKENWSRNYLGYTGRLTPEPRHEINRASLPFLIYLNLPPPFSLWHEYYLPLSIAKFPYL